MTGPVRDSRVNLRIPSSVKDELAATLAELRADGHLASEADVVLLFIREGLARPNITERMQQHRRDLQREQ